MQCIKWEERINDYYYYYNRLIKGNFTDSVPYSANKNGHLKWFNFQSNDMKSLNKNLYFEKITFKKFGSNVLHLVSEGKTEHRLPLRVFEIEIRFRFWIGNLSFGRSKSGTGRRRRWSKNCFDGGNMARNDCQMQRGLPENTVGTWVKNINF